MSENLTSKTLHGLKWSYLGTIMKSVLQIGFTAIMARLLEPAAFGLIAMAGVILRFGSYFAQMGLGSALIQKKEICDEDIRAAFTSALLQGILFFALVWLAAPLVIYIFENKKIIPIIRIMALSFAITGLTTTALSLLRRNLEFRSLFIAEIISYVLGYGIIGILLAHIGFGVWSLVAAALCQGVLLAIISYIFSRHKISFIFRWKYYKPLYSFGGRVSIISFFEFIGSNLDTLAIGHLIGAAPLGIYNRAFMLVNLPAQNLTTSFSRVLFPSFSRVQEDLEKLKKAYLTTIMIFASILFPTCLGIAVASREIVLLVLGEKWVAAIPVLQILAIATPFNLVSHFGGIVCEATATLNIKLLMQIIYVIILGTLFYLLSGYGILGFATAILIGEFIRYVLYFFLIKHICKISLIEGIRAYVPSLIPSIAIGTLIYFFAFSLRNATLQIPLVFSVELTVGVLTFFSLFYLTNNAVKREIRNRLFSSGTIEIKNSFFSKIVTNIFQTRRYRK